jgi:hypothetical protein
MKFLCLICADTNAMMEYLSKPDAAKHFDEYLNFTRDIKRRGHFLGGNRLTPPATATTIRVRGGKVLRTDGPFAETKEQLGGYYLIEAANMDEAVEIAAKIPGARFGCVELRPVADDPQTAALGLDTP